MILQCFFNELIIKIKVLKMGRNIFGIEKQENTNCNTTRYPDMQATRSDAYFSPNMW